MSLTDSEKLQQLIEAIENSVPYVAATISPGNCLRNTDDKDWVGVHHGRVMCSRQHLERLMEKVKSFK